MILNVVVLRRSLLIILLVNASVRGLSEFFKKTLKKRETNITFLLNKSKNYLISFMDKSGVIKSPFETIVFVKSNQKVLSCYIRTFASN